MVSQQDNSVIRPQLRLDDIQLRRDNLTHARLKQIKKALRTLHTLETMAVNIYQYQITSKPTEHNRYLIAAMCNEMTHLQDFQTSLYEYGLRPSPLRWTYWLFGTALGITSRILGRKAILKTGVWVEQKAVHHYEQLLNRLEWDPHTRNIILKNQSDESEHIHRWKSLLQS